MARGPSPSPPAEPGPTGRGLDPRPQRSVVPGGSAQNPPLNGSYETGGFQDHVMVRGSLFSSERSERGISGRSRTSSTHRQRPARQRPSRQRPSRATAFPAAPSRQRPSLPSMQNRPGRRPRHAPDQTRRVRRPRQSDVPGVDSPERAGPLGARVRHALVSPTALGGAGHRERAAPRLELGEHLAGFDALLGR